MNLDIQITKDFTLRQLTHSDMGVRNHFDEQFNPSQSIIDDLTQLAKNILQPLRDSLGENFFIPCAYRCPRVNKAVGGAATSQHLLGQASDNIYSKGNIILAKKIIELNLPFDQLIIEGGTLSKPNWIHVSHSARHRKEILRADFSTGKAVYTKLTGEQIINA